MQGVNARPNAAPMSAGEPLRRAGSSAGWNMRSSAGIGSSPSSAKPIATTRMPDAIVSSSRWPRNADPSSPAATPSTTNTQAKPSTKGIAARTARRPAPGPPVPGTVPVSAAR